MCHFATMYDFFFAAYPMTILLHLEINVWGGDKPLTYESRFNLRLESN